MKKKCKPRFAYYAEPKVRPADPQLQYVRFKLVASNRLSWPADCRWWNYSDRPAPYKPGSPR